MEKNDILIVNNSIFYVIQNIDHKKNTIDLMEVEPLITYKYNSVTIPIKLIDSIKQKEIVRPKTILNRISKEKDKSMDEYDRLANLEQSLLHKIYHVQEQGKLKTNTHSESKTCTKPKSDEADVTIIDGDVTYMITVSGDDCPLWEITGLTHFDARTHKIPSHILEMSRALIKLYKEHKHKILHVVRRS